MNIATALLFCKIVGIGSFSWAWVFAALLLKLLAVYTKNKQEKSRHKEIVAALLR